jgi:hypothetical protein
MWMIEAPQKKQNSPGCKKLPQKKKEKKPWPEVKENCKHCQISIFGFV